MAKKRLISFIAFAIGLTLLVFPFRSEVSQDDGVYADWVLTSLQGDWRPAPLLLTAAWPQMVLAHGAVRLLTTFHPLVVMNTLTWAWFIVLVGTFVFSFRRQSLVFILGFFCFPIWAQYGASFLSDTYGVLFLVLILATAESRRGAPWVVFFS